VTPSDWTNLKGHIIGIRFLPGAQRLNFFQLRLVTDFERHQALTAVCERDDSPSCPAAVLLHHLNTKGERMKIMKQEVA
jgi:hypothetical protein